MTGIERLHEVVRELGRFSFCYDLYETLGNIARQIERERECDADTIENLRLELGEARDDAAWVREHGGLDSVKKLLDWVVGHCSTRQQLDFDFWLSGRVMHELGFEEDMADRDEVERRLLARLMPEGCDWEFIKLHMSNLRGFMLDVIDRLGVDKSDSDAPEIVFDVLDRRLMPEGYEWPRFEDGEPVRIGDVVSDVEVRSVVFRDDGILLSDCTSVPGWGTWRSYKEPIKRSAPKVLDADGVEICVGDTVWATNGHGPFEVTRTVYADRLRVICDDEKNGHLNAYPEMLTHRAPVIAADGKPLEVGQTVYVVSNGHGPFHIDSVESDGAVTGWSSSIGSLLCTDPANLTHERPVLDADGVPIKVGDTVYFTDGREQECNTVVYAEYDYKDEPYVQLGRLNDVGYPTYTNCSCIDPSQLTHTKPEPPDSWERLEKDADRTASLFDAFDADASADIRDLMRRAKALAERDA